MHFFVCVLSFLYLLIGSFVLGVSILIVYHTTGMTHTKITACTSLPEDDHSDVRNILKTI